MIRLRSLLLCMVLFLPLNPGGARAEAPNMVQAAGRNVLDLQVSGAQIPAQELSALVPFSPGSPLRPELVREGVRNFYRTGLYDRVDVYVKESLGGVTVRFSLSPKKWLEKTEFEGNLYLDDRELGSKVDLRNSEEVTGERLSRNVKRLQEYYRHRGFTDTEVGYRIETVEQDRTRVTFTIREGTRQFISDVRLTGDPGLSRTKLLSLIASMPGSDLDGRDLDNDMKRVRDHLRKRMYLTPTVTYELETSGDFRNGVRVTINIDKGPAFRLRVLLDDAREAAKLAKRARSVFLKSVMPEKASAAVKKQILDRYRKEGYHFTTVDLDDSLESGGDRVITISVDRGVRALIGEVRIEGVEFFSEEKTGQVVGLIPGEPFVQDRMEKGFEDLAREYRREGFLSTSFTRHPLNFVPRGEVQEVQIRLEVQEGPRKLLRGLKVAGSPLQEGEALKILGAGPGDPYVPEVLDRGRDDLLQELGRRGYLYASAAVEEPEMHPDDTVDLLVTVKEGPLVRLSSVIVTGNDGVDTRIIRRALDLNRGEILTRDKLIKAQNRIYDLRVMSSVDVQLADPQTPDAYKDLMVRVKERPKYVVGLRFGYGSEDQLRGEFSVTNRNFRQMARSLSLRAKASAIERSTTLLYTHPWFQGLPMDMSLSLRELFEERESYSRDSFSVGVDFVRALSERTESRFGYFFEGLRLSDVAPDAQLSPDDEGKTDLAALVGEILHDARDDFLDPWSGILGDVILEYAAGYLGSRAEYVKAEIAVRRYQTITDSLVLAGMLRLGQVTAYGESEEVIISKRFFLGGANSVRGYSLDSLGPRDAEGDPVGGNYMLNANLELRYPLFRSIRGVIFVDSGSVWLKDAVDPEDEELRLRASAGAGLRWGSPIGPLSLDYGYKLNPVEEDERDRFRWHFSIGHAF